MEKGKTIEGFQIHERDTGSADVQVALLTERINHLTEHLQKNIKTTVPGAAFSKWSASAAVFWITSTPPILSDTSPSPKSSNSATDVSGISFARNIALDRKEPISLRRQSRAAQCNYYYSRQPCPADLGNFNQRPGRLPPPGPSLKFL